MKFSPEMIINAMIDFRKLVLEALSYITEAVNKPLSDFYTDTANRDITDIKTFLSLKFNITDWPTPTSMFPTLASVAIREGAVRLIPYAELFPLCDFIWYIAQSLPAVGSSTEIINGTKQIEDGQLKTLIGNFKTSCSNSNSPGVNGLNPLFGYTPISSAGNQNIAQLRKKISNNIIGKMSLETFNNFSIKRAFYGLLEARKKTRKAVLNKDNTPTSNKFVDDILKNPDAYTNIKQVPAEVASLYNRVDSVQLIEIADEMRSFFHSELVKFGIDIKPDPKKTTIDQFISNELLPGVDVFTFVHPTSGNIPAVPPNGPGKGGYTIENIKKLNTSASKSLIAELEQFASFISEGEPRNWTGVVQGIGQVAKGMSFGAKAMGT